MFKRLIITCLTITLLAACQTTPPPAAAPTIIPFPTTTPGRVIRGVLPTISVLQLSGSSLSNPATAVALANRPTATPDYATCPPISSPTLSNSPSNAREIGDEIVRYLSAGGTAIALQNALRDDWQVLGETGFVRADADLTREGQPEVIVSYAAPGEGGRLLILGCANGRYALHSEVVAGGADAPEVMQLGDMNFDFRPEILLTALICDGENVDDCAYRTQLLTWQPDAARFSSLLDSVLSSPEKPTISDIDNDRVVEIVLRQTNNGTSETGPLRTGVTIYDWNGVHYTQSITQLDPPEFRIQVIHQADRNMQRLDAEAAIPQYQLALNDTTLRNWFNDDQTTLQSYALYRLLTAYAYTESDQLLTMYQTIVQAYPDPVAAPVYTSMSLAFWNALQVSNNLRSACQAVQDIITARPEALELLNRYGSRGPTYTANELCPF